ncbi:hypothetical protein BDV30DRAFT_213524 [Aspergillus minisclerotigenes]|uniref:Protein kinase domain-containing protein n=1 Tax=Aspergillus minisclerotigenes TaxID=656917 RepID=A0A5N6IYL4_9EURO|nr:hypothetical protein BDV30DRAFT_213524 [Aspergillus minisclerotigenes]
MAHVHFVARNWHQDIKPPNVLLDSDQNVRIIDWEQCGANPFIMAPEIDGTWDAVELDQEVNGRRQIAYHRYEGPKRVNQAVEPRWNSHPDWNQNCPRASELAEVFSLGRTMWIILEQIGLERTVGVTDYSTVVIQWSRWSDDIPAPWKHMVELSMAHNPNDRPLMNELLGFWEKELQGHRLSS